MTNIEAIIILRDRMSDNSIVNLALIQVANKIAEKYNMGIYESMKHAANHLWPNIPREWKQTRKPLRSMMNIEFYKITRCMEYASEQKIIK